MSGMPVDLSTYIGPLGLQNPIMTASGTFGYGREYAPYFDLGRLGAVMVKGVSTEPWMGNPVPRIAETPAGMLNSIGLQNPGVDKFIEVDLPFLRQFNTQVIVNVIGKTVGEYAEVCRRLDSAEGVAAVEINISCPNIRHGGIEFGKDPVAAARVVEAVKEATRLPVIPKLSPNVTDITVMARALESAGADALSMINTLRGMAIDVHKRRPVLATYFGGLSGPAIKPIAVRMVWEVYEAVKIPIIGMGGIMTAEDALEFILAGARAVAVGTANFVNPLAPIEVLDGLVRFCEENGVPVLSELVGAAHEGTVTERC